MRWYLNFTSMIQVNEKSNSPAMLWRECNRNCVSFSNLLSRFYQMPELSDNLLTHFLGDPGV